MIRVPLLTQLVGGVFFAVALGALARAQTIDAARVPDPIAELRQAITRRYAYRALAHVDWPARVDEFTRRLRATSTPLDFAQVASELLSVAADPHVFLEVDGRRVYSTHPSPPLTFERELIAPLVPDVTSDHQCVSFGHAGEGVGYLVVGSWTDACAASAEHALDALVDQPLLIVDVRPNAGGDDTLAGVFAGRFVDHDTRYGWVETVADGGFAPRRPRVLRPNPRDPHYAGRVAVLMGPTCMSSNESFLLMMRAAGARLVGNRSYGSTGNPQPIALSNGVTVWLPSWREYALDGRLIEGAGIAPDVEVAWPRAPSEDVVLRTAIELLRAR